MPDDIREGVKGQDREARREMAAERRTKGDPINQEGDPSKRLTARQGRKSVKPVRSWSRKTGRYRYNEGEDKAFNFVVNKLKSKYGDGVMTTGEKMKPQSAADKAKARAHQAKVDKAKIAAERKKRQDADNKAFAGRAKKAGYKSTQDYANVVARYGSEDNMKKGKGLGT